MNLYGWQQKTFYQKINSYELKVSSPFFFILHIDFHTHTELQN